MTDRIDRKTAMHAETFSFKPQEGRKRVVIEGVSPEIDCGRFPAKRTVGEVMTVEADCFSDGHEAIRCRLLYKHASRNRWMEVPMHPVGNDRWRATFPIDTTGYYLYTFQAWVDPFQGWRRDLKKKVEAGLPVTVDLQVGAELVRQIAERASKADAEVLHATAGKLETDGDLPGRISAALEEELAELMARYPDRRFATTYPRELKVFVEREQARFSSWYELFPRSCGRGTEHGTLKDCAARLPYIAEMGFDVVYLPPLHPIGRTHRKGRNNAPKAEPDDCGSPWAIGAAEGGHKAIHPQLGTLEDFHYLVQEAARHGLEIALDIALQCSPDHPYVREHPEWFRHRPDGTIQYAENPPKKYEDIYPFDFQTEHWEELWEELKSIFLFWIEQGVQIFRVDNPHTKPFPFWEWLIAEVKTRHPDVIFLSEAFTRPKVMYRLAKLGFSQSYTYFAWRNTKQELTEYFTELTQTPVRDFFRPNAWPNTPDILTEYLQYGGRPAFIIRLVLAATLSASYGIYGPAFELCEHQARHPGSEEYLDSEKYQIREWELDRPDSLRLIIARVNQIRKENPALQRNDGLRFHPVDNEHLLCYSKTHRESSNLIVVVVNLDPYHSHSGWVELPLEELGIEPDRPYQMHDLLGEARFLWQGSRHFVELNPQTMPAHIFRVRRHVRTEHDFEYYL